MLAPRFPWVNTGELDPLMLHNTGQIYTVHNPCPNALRDPRERTVFLNLTSLTLCLAILYRMRISSLPMGPYGAARLLTSYIHASTNSWVDPERSSGREGLACRA